MRGGVGLDHLVHHAATGGAHAAAEGADDSGGDGELESVGIADGDGELAYFESLRSAESGWRQDRHVGAEDSGVGVGVFADEGGRDVLAVSEGEADVVGFVDDVAVGHDEAVGGEDEA